MRPAPPSSGKSPPDGARPAPAGAGVHRGEHHLQRPSDRGHRQKSCWPIRSWTTPAWIRTPSSAVRDLIRNSDSFMPSPEIIIEETGKCYGIDVSDIMGSSRTKEVTIARQVSMYIIRNLTKLSLPDRPRVPAATTPPSSTRWKRWRVSSKPTGRPPKISGTSRATSTRGRID